MFYTVRPVVNLVELWGVKCIEIHFFLRILLSCSMFVSLPGEWLEASTLPPRLRIFPQLFWSSMHFRKWFILILLIKQIVRFINTTMSIRMFYTVITISSILNFNTKLIYVYSRIECNNYAVTRNEILNWKDL